MTPTGTKLETHEERLARLRQATQLLHKEVQTVEELAAQRQCAARLEEEIRELHEQLRRVQRLAALGTMSAMLAHEFNNILTPIINYAQMARKNPRLREKAVTRAAEGGQRASDICQAILGIARGSSPEPVRVNVSALVSEAILAMGRNPRRDAIDVVLSAPADLAIRTRKVELEHVLLNLLINARQAVLDRPRPRKIEISARTCDGGAVIRVRDNGPGIPPEIQPRVFEPFFTTRTGRDGKDEGSGLGLALSREIVQSLGGEIRLESQPGKGATFTVQIPA